MVDGETGVAQRFQVGLQLHDIRALGAVGQVAIRRQYAVEQHDRAIVDAQPRLAAAYGRPRRGSQVTVPAALLASGWAAPNPISPSMVTDWVSVSRFTAPSWPDGRPGGSAVAAAAAERRGPTAAAATTVSAGADEDRPPHPCAGRGRRGADDRAARPAAWSAASVFWSHICEPSRLSGK